MPAVGSFLGSTLGEGAAFAAGIAVGPLLRPLVQALENETWSQYPDAPLQAVLIAQAVLEGKISPSDGEAEAALTGISSARFASLQAALAAAPSIAAGLTLLRRGQITQAEFGTVLTRAGLEAEWVTAYTTASAGGLAYYNEPLSPADIALGVIRNNIANQAANGNPIAQNGLPIAQGNVPQNPVSSLNAETEAALSGIDLERLSVLIDNVGLPPGVIEGLRMLNRGIITEGDFALLIAQSDARLAWGPALMALRWNIPTVHQAADALLKGVDSSTANFQARAAADGYQPDVAQLFYDLAGHGLSVADLTRALAIEGSEYDDWATVNPLYVEAMQRQGVRPEWQKYVYLATKWHWPNYFELKALVPSSVSVATATSILTYQGNPPALAAEIAQSFASASAGTDTSVTSSKTSLVTKTRDQYVAGAISKEQATSALQTAGKSDAAITSLFELWDAQISVLNPSEEIGPPGGG
jgi:hypothetical protein